MLLVGDELVFISDNGIATCLNAKTGDEHWKERIEGNYSASPLFADGRFYFFSQDGVTNVVAPGTEYKHLAENTLDGGFMASPTAGAHARADATPSQEQAGAQIGRYKLLEQIGEAGMGSIWMAVLSIIRNRGHLIVTRGFALLRHEAEVA